MIYAGTDTSHIATRLSKKGASLELSKELAQIFKEQEMVSIKYLATKDDLNNIRSELDFTIQELRQDLKLTKQQLRHEIHSNTKDIKNFVLITNISLITSIFTAMGIFKIFS